MYKKGYSMYIVYQICEIDKKTKMDIHVLAIYSY